MRRQFLIETKLLAALTIMGLIIISGCGKANIPYDIDQILREQKIVYIMSVSSYDEPYTAGYFIDGNGKKHIYGLYNQRPFESIEKEYAYLLEHYDEFETMDFFEDKTLKKCTQLLYYVNTDSETRKEGEVIFDCPYYILYGIKQIDGHEEIVRLESYSGILERLDDLSADQIYEIFGDKWYLRE